MLTCVRVYAQPVVQLSSKPPPLHPDTHTHTHIRGILYILPCTHNISLQNEATRKAALNEPMRCCFWWNIFWYVHPDDLGRLRQRSSNCAKRSCVLCIYRPVCRRGTTANAVMSSSICTINAFMCERGARAANETTHHTPHSPVCMFFCRRLWAAT